MVERALRLELTNTGSAIRRLSRLATRADLERKERFELSKRVWKTRMFPATSLPRRFGTPGRTRTRSLDLRSVALFQLSYRSEEISNFGLRISELQNILHARCADRVHPTIGTNPQFEIRNPKFSIGRGGQN